LKRRDRSSRHFDLSFRLSASAPLPKCCPRVCNVKCVLNSRKVTVGNKQLHINVTIYEFPLRYNVEYISRECISDALHDLPQIQQFFDMKVKKKGNKNTVVLLLVSYPLSVWLKIWKIKFSRTCSEHPMSGIANRIIHRRAHTILSFAVLLSDLSFISCVMYNNAQNASPKFNHMTLFRGFLSALTNSSLCTFCVACLKFIWKCFKNSWRTDGRAFVRIFHLYMPTYDKFIRLCLSKRYHVSQMLVNSVVTTTELRVT
jgi:hypothetical protein